MTPCVRTHTQRQLYPVEVYHLQAWCDAPNFDAIGTHQFPHFVELFSCDLARVTCKVLLLSRDLGSIPASQIVDAAGRRGGVQASGEGGARRNGQVRQPSSRRFPGSRCPGRGEQFDSERERGRVVCQVATCVMIRSVLLWSRCCRQHGRSAAPGRPI